MVTPNEPRPHKPSESLDEPIEEEPETAERAFGGRDEEQAEKLAEEERAKEEAVKADPA
jgi:predicted CopG family antitoxin